MNRSKGEFVTGDDRNQYWSEEGPAVSKISTSAFGGLFILILNEDFLLRMKVITEEQK